MQDEAEAQEDNSTAGAVHGKVPVIVQAQLQRSYQYLNICYYNKICTSSGFTQAYTQGFGLVFCLAFSIHWE